MRRIKKSERQAEVMRFPSGIIASGFGIGLLPSAPGTWASAATLPIGWLIGTTTGPFGLLLAALCVFAVGVVVSSTVMRMIEAKDPSVIVIDEVAGQLLTLAATPLSIPAYIAAFVVFRAFDLAKPWPASWADRELGSGFGAMVDDMLAGAYGALAMLATVYLGWL